MTILDGMNLVLTAGACLVLVPILAFCVETASALLSHKRRRSPVVGDRPRAVVLIPAHNEELLIEETLRVATRQLAHGDRILVVADNCDDRTARIASRAGARVVERNDVTRRGKGYALDHGFGVLKRDPPDVVVILDADCLVRPEAVDLLVRQAHQTGRPVQALNLTDRNGAAGPIQGVAALANRFTNQIRPLGLAGLNMPCRLMGTGAAIPWPLIGKLRPTGANLVEDMQCGIDLAVDGFPPLFFPQARVTSGLPPQDRAFVGQSTRWDHGHLRTAATQIPRLLAAAVRRGRLDLAVLALDLSILPLSLLVALWLGAGAAALTAWLLGASWLPLAMLAVGGLLFTTLIGLGWAVFCRRQIPFTTFACVPWYVLRKLPIYAGFLVRRQQLWVRTDRSSK